MKTNIKLVLLSFLFLGLASTFSCAKDDCTQEALSTKITSGSSARGASKITVCHVLGNGDTQTIEIDEDDLQFHLDHGDIQGECPTLSDGGLHFDDGNIVEIACKYELPFIHVAEDGSQWYFSKPKR